MDPLDKKPKGHGRRSKRQRLESDARMRYYDAKAEAAEAANARALGILVDPAIIDDALEQVVRELAAGLDALPSQIKVDIPHLRASEVHLITQRVARMRNALARFEPKL